jgi:hypothetical protein
MPPARAGEEDRLTLFFDSLHAALRTPDLLPKLVLNPVRQASKALKGYTGEWWSMACVRVDPSPKGQPQWVIAVVDSTEKSVRAGGTEVRDHPNHLLDGAVMQCQGPLPIGEIKDALCRAILIPVPGGGHTRRPECVTISWSMRQYCPALKELGSRSGSR